MGIYHFEEDGVMDKAATFNLDILIKSINTLKLVDVYIAMEKNHHVIISNFSCVYCADKHMIFTCKY